MYLEKEMITRNQHVLTKNNNFGHKLYYFLGGVIRWED